MTEILPLALTMMIGPQIITSIILATAKEVVKPSLAYISGVALAATTGTIIFYLVANLFDLTDQGSGEPSRAALIIQGALVLLLVFASIKTYLGRQTVKLPGWMSKLQNTTPREAFKTGLLLILLMPSDLIIMSTVGINLASNSSETVKLIPFIALTVLIAALPLIAYLAFHKRAVVAMPKVRKWMEINSWVVNIVAYAVFIFLLWP